MPIKKKAAGHKRAAKKGKVTVRVTYHSRPVKYAPDTLLPAKRAMAYAVFAIALAISMTAFYDAGYYSTGFAVVATAPSYIATVADASGGPASSNSFKMDVSMGEPVVGNGKSTNFGLTLGAMAFLGGDAMPPKCTIRQSTGAPARGAEVTLTTTCTDDIELKEIALYTDESGTMKKTTSYGSPAAATGTAKTVTFKWKNQAVTTNTTVTWKVIATDSSGNDGESTTLAFTVGGVPDTTKPVAGKPAASPTSPTEGTDVTVTSQLTDNKELAGADLLVNGEVVDSATVSGTSEKAEFAWTPPKAGTYTIKVAATDGAGNSAESAGLVLTVKAAVTGCKTEKPAEVLGECKDGIQTKTAYVCDAATKTWKPLETTGECEAPSSVAFIALGIVALAVAAGAAYYLIKTGKIKIGKKTEPAEAPTAPQTPSEAPPATFG